ncbi:DUF3618 domain-containing protein [Conexibacter arvalis]|uniref:ElaB/YqjD/DUF883 family membrane-anchored ribosome-binding protein n=1 Tax=Conexibacter arvalis TaxID=912552 RepID=A0A840IDE4_9ACTN|nr:DUF3618 domain-containing protein [Conexibacter arvalis]MBB4662058.1 ElaB/YqjD/DUF883 family membrane-anchored ribosome-binding protein [Conexibacter arvalis]
MGDDPRTDGTPTLIIAEGDPVRIRQQIEATRVELGDTVAALAAKTDVKQQARERIAVARRRAMERRAALMHRAEAAGPAASDRATQASHAAAEQARAHPLPLIALGAAAAGFLLGRMTGR